MQESSSIHPVEDGQGFAWQARREALLGSTAYWELLNGLSSEGGFDLSFADEAATAILCLLDQQIQLRSPAGARPELPPHLAELVVGCGGRHGVGGVLDPEDFIANVADALSVSEQRAMVLVKGVFSAVHKRLTPAEVVRVARLAPRSLRRLWRGVA